jgi:hypothetical protein
MSRRALIVTAMVVVAALVTGATTYTLAKEDRGPDRTELLKLLSLARTAGPADDIVGKAEVSEQTKNQAPKPGTFLWGALFTFLFQPGCVGNAFVGDAAGFLRTKTTKVGDSDKDGFADFKQILLDLSIFGFVPGFGTFIATAQNDSTWIIESVSKKGPFFPAFKSGETDVTFNSAQGVAMSETPVKAEGKVHGYPPIEGGISAAGTWRFVDQAGVVVFCIIGLFMFFVAPWVVLMKLELLLMGYELDFLFGEAI